MATVHGDREDFGPPVPSHGSSVFSHGPASKGERGHGPFFRAERPMRKVMIVLARRLRQKGF